MLCASFVVQSSTATCMSSVVMLESLLAGIEKDQSVCSSCLLCQRHLGWMLLSAVVCCSLLCCAIKKIRNIKVVHNFCGPDPWNEVSLALQAFATWSPMSQQDCQFTSVGDWYSVQCLLENEKTFWMNEVWHSLMSPESIYCEIISAQGLCCQSAVLSNLLQVWSLSTGWRRRKEPICAINCWPITWILWMALKHLSGPLGKIGSHWFMSTHWPFTFHPDLRKGNVTTEEQEAPATPFSQASIPRAVRRVCSSGSVTKSLSFVCRPWWANYSVVTWNVFALEIHWCNYSARYPANIIYSVISLCTDSISGVTEDAGSTWMWSWSWAATRHWSVSLGCLIVLSISLSMVQTSLM